MTKVIGIRFRKAGKVYYFSPGENEIKTGDHVIVETARGVEYGYVVLGTHEVDDKKVIQPLKCVIRMATPADEETERRNKEKEKEAFKVCVEKIKKHNLSMKLIDTEYTFDNNKVLLTEMEGGAIAQVCLRNNVPFVAVKSVSDHLFREGQTEEFFDFAHAMEDLGAVVLPLAQALQKETL